MPAQALIRHLNKATIDQTIASVSAGDLLEVVPHGDAFLVRCKTDESEVHNLPGAAEALQAVCDVDAVEVRKIEAEEKKKIEAKKAEDAKKATGGGT